MKKSVHQIWSEAKEQNLNNAEFKAYLKKEGVIVGKSYQQIMSEMDSPAKIELFKKYNINESHSEWDETIDNWMSIEIFRIMHQGRLPNPEDKDFGYITNFLDDCSNPKTMNGLMLKNDFGSLYLTAKRMVYRYHEQILN